MSIIRDHTTKQPEHIMLGFASILCPQLRSPHEKKHTQQHHAKHIPALRNVVLMLLSGLFFLTHGYTSPSFNSSGRFTPVIDNNRNVNERCV